MVLNDVSSFQQLGKTITTAMLTRVFDTVLGCMQAMSTWSAKILEQSAYKYSKPCTDADYRARGGKPIAGQEYGKAVRYNYSASEMHALIDVVGMVKGLGALMMDSEAVLMPLIRRHIHDETQEFLQTSVFGPLRKAHKRGRSKVRWQGVLCVLMIYHSLLLSLA
jgi:cytoplasmic FMR1 interacting protein